MCGRYYVDEEIIKEIEQLIPWGDEKQKQEAVGAMSKMVAGDIHPGKDAFVLSEQSGSICCRRQRWGFPGFQEKKLIFNARCESALEKSLFCDGVRSRRIVIPASWFYEWNSRKEKNTFRRKDTPVMYMAGFSKQYEDGEHFVILTTAASASMKSVHDRMPLILEQEEVVNWLLDGSRTESFLHKAPCLLERKTDYEQMSLFDL